MRTSKTRSTALRRVCLGISQLFGAAQAQAGNGKGARHRSADLATERSEVSPPTHSHLQDGVWHVVDRFPVFSLAANG